MYTGYSTEGPLILLVATRDFREYERRGVLLPPHEQGRRPLPGQVGGRYALLHRPMAGSQGPGRIWLSFSPDLVHWGDHRPSSPPAARGSWASHKVGARAAAAPHPREGWLLLYHGVRHDGVRLDLPRRARAARPRAARARPRPVRRLGVRAAGALRARRRRRQRRLPVRLGARRRRRHAARLLRRRRHLRLRRDREPREPARPPRR